VAGCRRICAYCIKLQNSYISSCIFLLRISEGNRGIAQTNQSRMQTMASAACCQKTIYAVFPTRSKNQPYGTYFLYRVIQRTIFTKHVRYALKAKHLIYINFNANFKSSAIRQTTLCKNTAKFDVLHIIQTNLINKQCRNYCNIA
jgi:hypothetical protein